MKRKYKQFLQMLIRNNERAAIEFLSNLTRAEVMGLVVMAQSVRADAELINGFVTKVNGGAGAMNK